jgi:hypothetical protein
VTRSSWIKHDSKANTLKNLDWEDYDDELKKK